MKFVSIFVLSIGLALGASAQTSVGIHAGASNKNAVVGFDAQHRFDCKVFLDGNMTTHLDSKNPVLFQARLGYSLGNKFSINPYIGYVYRLTNVDREDYGHYFSTGAQLRVNLSEHSLLYIDGTVFTGYRILTLGIAGIL